MKGHARTPQGQLSLLTRHVAKSQCCFLEGHPSSDQDIEMEAPDDDEEMDPMSSDPRDKSQQPEKEEQIFYPSKEFHKYNYVVNLSEMADLAEGGELHVGQLDLHTNPNGTMREYNHVLDSFGGASVIPQPGDEAVCEGVLGYSCMTSTLPKGLHLEVMNMQNRGRTVSTQRLGPTFTTKTCISRQKHW